MLKKLFILIMLCCVMVLPSFSKKDLTYEQAFLPNGKIFNELPKIRGWLDDRFYLEMRGIQFFKVDARNGRGYPLHDEAHAGVIKKNQLSFKDIVGGNSDYSKLLFLKSDVLYYLDASAKKIDKLNASGKNLKNPVFSPDGNSVAYTRGGNLFVYHMATAKEIQLTKDGSSDILNGYASWVYYEEILGRRGKYRAFWWSPDSKKIAFIRFDQTNAPVFPIFRATGDVYGDLEKQRYPKPGFPNPTVEIKIASIASKTVECLDYKDPEAEEFYLSFPVFSKTSDTLYFQWLNRGQNHLKILRYNLKTRAIETAYEEKQDTWVDFPGFEDLFVLRDGRLVLRSSKSGWDHVYMIDKKGNRRQLTSGLWSVASIHVVNEKRKRIYFSARKEDSTELDCYSIDFNGKGMKRLTRGKGFHMVSMSENGTYFVDRYSNITTPTALSLYTHKGGLVRALGDMYNKELDDYNLAKTELFRIKTTDGYELPAVWFLPHDFDKSKRYPVVLNVYGGPGSTSVYNMFPYRSPLSRHFMANLGMIVMAVDHRGSGHFGKKGMDLMHRKLGEIEMNDYIEVVKYLRQLPFVDGNKIGITGGSYGGYATALALTKHPEYFNYGIADFSVIDWRLYDSVYTERYMDLPFEKKEGDTNSEYNLEGYKKSDVLTYIDNYKGGLRITHGTMDDNVHCQNTIRFIDLALDRGKTVELMLYPGERHGFRSKKRNHYNKAGIDFWMRHFFGKSFK